jgi:hypothetical protein
MFDNMTPAGMRLCRFCGSLVPEAQYIKHKQEISGKGGQALQGTKVAYKKARNAARVRWSRYFENSLMLLGEREEPSGVSGA